MRKVLLVVLCILLIIGLLVTACGKEKTTPTLTATATATATSTPIATATPTPTPTAVRLSGTIKLGLPIDLTGTIAPYGQDTKRGLDMALAEINSSGMLGDAKIELVVDDTASDRTLNITAVNREINQDKVLAILGPYTSPSVRAAATIVDQAKVPAITLSAGEAGLTSLSPYIFQARSIDADLLKNVVQVMVQKLNLKKVAVTWPSDESNMVSQANTYKQEFTRLAVQIVAEGTSLTTDTDYRPVLTKLLSANPDAIAMTYLGTQIPTAVKQLRDLGYKGPILGHIGFSAADVVKAIASYVEPVYIPQEWLPDSPNPKSQAYVANYKAKYNLNPAFNDAAAYDGLYLVANAIKNAGTTTDREAFRNALLAVSYDGVRGQQSFSAQRSLVLTPVLATIHNGQVIAAP